MVRRTPPPWSGSPLAPPRATAPAAADELERLALALGAHDPQRTMARGYAMVQTARAVPLGSASAARAAGELALRFHDGAVAAHVAGEEETG